MRIRWNILLFTFFLPVLIYSQQPTAILLTGTVRSADGDVAATHVLNITTSRATITNINGAFAIEVHANDTLVFSAVQFKKKTVVVTEALLENTTFDVFLADELTELDEVVVTPYNLSGDIAKDILSLNIGPVVRAESLALPNAYVRIPTKSERELFEATSGGILSINPILNNISGRSKMLKQRVARNALYNRTERVRLFYADSIYQNQLKIPEDKIYDFFYFCEIDPKFQTMVDAHDILNMWTFLEDKSARYRENNNLD